MYIYALKLQDNKYYIGKTTNFVNRLNQHANSSGSDWTKIYKPIEVIFCKKITEYLKNNINCHKLENLYTEAFILKYGWENVKGGEYCKVKGNYSYLEKHLKLYSFLEEMEKYFSISL